MTHSHRHQALAHVDDAQISMLALDELLDAEFVENRGAKMTQLNNAIGRSLKLAQIHSHLAIAEAIAPTEVVEPWGRHAG